MWGSLGAVIFGAVAWLLRAVVFKAAILTGVVALVAIVVPLAIGLISPIVGDAASSFTALLSPIPDGVFYFLELFRLDVGMPLLISAVIARFLVRRLPGIG